MLFLWLWAGCAATSWEESLQGDLRLLTTSALTNAGGTIVVDLDVNEGETSLLLTGIAAEDRLIFVNRVTAPGGVEVFHAQDFWDLDTNRSNAAFSANTTTLNWPIDVAGPELSPGSWRFEVRVDAGEEPVDLSVVLKADDDLTTGALAVRVVLAASLTDNAQLMAGVDDAIALWQDHIYANPDGGLDPQIVVETSTTSADMAARIERPGFGDAALYEQLSAEKALHEVNLVITDRVTDSNDVLGISGGVPGPLVPARNAAVSLSALSAAEAAGRDGQFSAAEVELFAETMAHEVGHYLGLFHPAEIPVVGAEPPSWDALDDTDKCATFDLCMTTLGDNLMFPTPVCTDPFAFSCTDFVQQRSLTPLQVGLIQRYTGVR